MRVMRERFIIFFFRAEDGILDKLVTGVQTCALPIYRGLADRSSRTARPRFPTRSRGYGPEPGRQPLRIAPGTPPTEAPRKAPDEIPAARFPCRAQPVKQLVAERGCSLVLHRTNDGQKPSIDRPATAVSLPEKR